mmetsp:Transcript_101273/g.253884  ORF Transcript_101273/g.253884 Transcript_101273/m.253884 type:complete len:258 (+) Transcript_101273:79-852(+)
MPSAPGARRVAIVTGVARVKGIGRAVVRALLARPDWCVCASDVEELESPPPMDQARFVFVRADVRNASDAARVVARATEAFGEGVMEVSLLVNNAGISDPQVGGTVRSETEEALAAEFRRVIDTNLTGAFIMSRAVDAVLAPGACIVHISSTRARMSEAGTEAYAAAKAGLVGLMHSQAVSYAGRARVNCVLPGWIDTAQSPGEQPAEHDHAFHPAGRVGLPSDVADACLFLADQGFMTGAEIVVDGGVTRKMIYPE